VRRIFGPKREEVKEDVMGGTCSTDRIYEKCTVFWLQNPKGRSHSEDLGANKRIILE
jgi:hypothetical protein